MRTLEHPTALDETFDLSLHSHEWSALEALAARDGGTVDQFIGHMLEGLTADELHDTASRCE